MLVNKKEHLPAFFDDSDTVSESGLQIGHDFLPRAGKKARMADGQPEDQTPNA